MIKNLNLLFGTRFWYSVTIIYWVNGKRIFDFTETIGVPKKSRILNRRIVCGVFHNMIYNKNTRSLLKNGYTSVDIRGYLGWFKKEPNT